MFLHRELTGRVEVAFTDRHGGVSSGPFASLDLGTSTSDASAVARNVALLAEGLGVSGVLPMTQVHGRDVALVAAESSSPVADAMVTATPGLALLVRVADCTPVVLADGAAGLVGVAHAGRQGLVSGVVPAAVRAMREQGASSIRAWVGPRACGRCYELPADMAAAVDAVVPGTRSQTSWGTPAVDIGAGVLAQLQAEGVEVTDLGADRCTIEDESLFSYRRQGADSGRFGAVVVLR